MALAVFTIFAWVSAAILLAAGGYLINQARRIRRPDLPMGSSWGIPIEEARVSEGAWRAAHRAAWPLVGAAGIICAVHSIAIIMTLLFMGDDFSSFVLILICMGLFTAALVQWLARAGAKSAARAAVASESDVDSDSSSDSD